MHASVRICDRYQNLKLSFSFVGKWTLYSVLNSAESARALVLRYGYVFYPELTYRQTNVVFVAALTVKFEREAHFIRDDIWGYQTPYNFQMRLLDTGNSSLSVTEEMFDYKSGKKIMSLAAICVYIESSSRKPTVLPDWLTKKSSQVLDMTRIQNKSFQKRDPPPIPANTFIYEIKATDSDCDLNNHVNQATFVRWCTDVGAIASVKEKYQSFTEDIGMYAVENISVQYKGEVLRGGTVTIYTWEDMDDLRALHFIFKKDDTIVVIVKMDFYDDNDPLMKPAISKL